MIELGKYVFPVLIFRLFVVDLAGLLQLRWKIVEVCLSEEEKKIIFQDFQKPKLQKAENKKKRVDK